MSAGETLTLIAASAAAVVSIVNAFAAGWGRKEAKKQLTDTHSEVIAATDSADRKLDEIHVLTNSNLTEVQGKLRDAMARIDRLEQQLAEAAKPHRNRPRRR